MTSRMTTVIVVAVLALTIAIVPAMAASIVLDDFEAGVGRWRTNDQQAAGRQPSDIVTIYTVGRRIDGRMEQAALIEFMSAQNTWASVSLPIEGAIWAQHNMGQISLWIRGDGSDNEVDLILRSVLGEDRRDVSYVYQLPLESRDWQRRSIRLFAFADAEGNPLTAEALRGAYLLQFAKSGSWPSLSFNVDDIRVEPIPGVDGPVLAPAAGPLTVRVDFTRMQARMLGQTGANLGRDTGPVLDTPASGAAIARALEQLTPAVVRLRLSDFYDVRAGDYDLIRLNRAINWVGETGARALICLNPAWLAGEEGGAPRIDPEFEDVALRLVSMRRAGPTLRYYELYDRPLLSGQFDSVEGLIAGYNSLAARLLSLDPEARVGGPGLAAAWDSQVRGFLGGAENLHFLSLHFHGAHSAEVGAEALISAAATGTSHGLPDQLTLEQVRHLAESLRRPMPELFVTSMAMNSARDPDGTAADARIAEPFGAAWTAAAVLQSSPWVDKFLHHRLYDADWGLLDARGRAMPNYTAAWLLRHYAPRGSTLSQLLRPTSDVVIAAVWTPTARNALVVYSGEGPGTVAIDAVGIGTPLLVRERRLISAGDLGMFELPNSHLQTIEFEGPGVSVIQFVGDE